MHFSWVFVLFFSWRDWGYRFSGRIARRWIPCFPSPCIISRGLGISMIYTGHSDLDHLIEVLPATFLPSKNASFPFPYSAVRSEAPSLAPTQGKMNYVLSLRGRAVTGWLFYTAEGKSVCTPVVLHRPTVGTGVWPVDTPGHSNLKLYTSLISSL